MPDRQGHPALEQHADHLREPGEEPLPVLPVLAPWTVFGYT